MVNAIVRTLGRITGFRVDAAPRRKAAPIRRAAAALTLAVATLASATAQAQSTACTAINNNDVMDFTGTFTPNVNAPNTTARGAGLAAMSQRLKSAGYVGNQGVPTNDASFGSNTYTFTAGETINYTVTTSNVTKNTSSGISAVVSVANSSPGFDTTTTTDVNTPNTYRFTSTITSTTAAIAISIRRGNTTDGVTVSVTATCTPVAAPPTVTSVTPAAGPVAGGTVVTIAGTNLTGATLVAFDGVAATSVTVNSATQITATTPAGSPGLATVAVTTPGGTGSRTSAFTYVEAPTVTSIGPTSGPTGGGTGVILRGTNFDGVTAVAFGATAATSFVLTSDTQIAAVAPAGSGTVNIRVTTPGGTSADATANAYTYVPIPVVNALTPNAGPTAGGNQVTITGQNFTAGTTVKFGTADATNVAFNSQTQLTAFAPAGSPGPVFVTVTNANGTSATGPGNQYTYVAAPTVTSISPTAGPTAGGTSVTITGTNFVGTPSVTFGATAATNVTVVNATQITATSPTGTGTVDVRVTTQGGTSAAGAGDQFTYVPAPSVTSVSPNSGSTAGGTAVTVSGSNLAGASAVRFGGSLVTNVVVAGDGNSLTATTPAGTAGAAAVSVTTPGGTGTLAGGYTYVAPPAITQQPVNRTVAEGASTSFSITASGGLNFQWESAPAGSSSFAAVSNGGPYSNVTTSTLTISSIPASLNGRQYRAVVTNNAGTATSNAATLTVVQAPTANNQSVTAAFNTATAVTLTGSDPNTPARPLTYNVATAPQHGTLSGTAPNLTYTPAANYVGTDSFTFTVTNDFGSTSAPATVSITVAAPAPPAAPVVTAPANGSVTNNQRPVVTGTTAAGSTVTIYFDGAPSGTATVSGTGFSYTPSAQLGQGSHSVYAVASNAGGPSPNSNTNTFIVDTIPPAPPVIVTPANNSTTTSPRPVVSGIAEANATVQVVIDGSPTGTTTANASGNWSFTPTSDLSLGSHTAAARATDAAGNVSPLSATNTFTVAQAPAVTQNPSNQTVAVGQTATFSITASGSPSPTVQWQVSTDGVTFSNVPANGNGTSYTTPATVAGDNGRLYRAVVTNSAGSAASTAATLTVVQAPTANAQSVSVPYQTATAIALTGSDPNSPPRSLTYAIATNPAHGSLSGFNGSTGTVTYTPSAGYTGPDSFTFRVNNGPSTSAPATVSITVQVPGPTITGVSPASGTALGNTAVTITGRYFTGATAVTFGGTSVTSLMVVDDTTITATTPAHAPGAVAVAVTTSQGTGSTANAFTYVAPTIVVAPASLPQGTVGFAYSQTLTASGGAGTYTYAVTSGALPAGMTLSSGGTLSGTPTAGGPFTFTVTASDGSTPANGGPFSGSRAYSFTVGAPTITIAPGTLPNATTRVAYSQTLTASGGTAPYTYAVTQGALPAGITLSTTGVLSGTTTTAGSFNFTVTATDSSTGTGRYSGSSSYSLTVAAPTIAIAPASLPPAARTVAYSQQLTASGGTGPYTYTVTGGALPTGITLSSGGLLSGTPGSEGNFTFTVTARDTNGNTGTGNYTLTVAPPPITITPTTLPDGSVETPYSATLTATGTTAPYSFAVTGGSLPPGLSLSPEGTIAGTPDAEGSYAFTVTATDSGSPSASGEQAYTITIGAPAGGLTRTWVSGVGDDANACTRIAPCQTFAVALARTATGGEINCLDAGGYGPARITRSVSISCGDRVGRGGVLVSGGNGITVAAPADARVVLSGLDFEGVGNSAAPAGVNGVRFESGASLLIRNATFRGFRGHAIDVEPTTAAQLNLVNVRVVDSGQTGGTATGGVLVRPSGSVTVRATVSGSQVVGSRGDGIALETAAGTTGQVYATIVDSVVTGNAGAGIAGRGAGGTVQTSVSGTMVTGNGTGIVTEGTGSTTAVANSGITRNATGVSSTGGGATRSAGGNVLAGNGTDGAFNGTVPRQ